MFKSAETEELQTRAECLEKWYSVLMDYKRLCTFQGSKEIHQMADVGPLLQASLGILLQTVCYLLCGKRGSGLGGN